MQARIEIKKDEEGIDGVLDGYRGQAVDEERVLDSPVREEVTAAFDLYQHNLRKKCFPDKPAFVLTPNQISAFLQATVVKASHVYGYDWITGRYVSQLIQNSYDSGHNDFVLDTRPLGIYQKLCFLGADLKADRERRLRLTVEGDVSEGFADGAKNITMHLHGSIIYHDSVKGAEGCEIIVDGNVRHRTFLGVRNCQITVKGKVPSGCGAGSRGTDFRVYYKKEAAYELEPLTGFNGALDCTFNEERNQNRIILVYDNWERVVYDFRDAR